MKERPILFSGPMVRAILEGRKTQTRRVVKPQSAILTDETARALGVQPPKEQNVPVIPCPYGKAGDRLWVRETWKQFSPAGDVSYRADIPESTCKAWKPSIHMPRWASRILLEVVSVRVERLQDISLHDCIHEGAPMQRIENIDEQDQAAEIRCWYENLWESINGQGSWFDNPWVWVVEFKKIGGV